MAEEKRDKIFFELAPLPSSGWLEKGILGRDGKGIIVSKETLSFHYGKHHAGYVKKLNAALNIAEKSGDSFPTDLVELITKTSNNVKYQKIFNCAAQHWNHAFYWNCMVNIPDANWKIGDAGEEPTVIAAIKKNLGDDFLQTFSAAAAGLFGSGWAWLVYYQGKIEIVKTSDAMNPLVNGKVPLLVCDVWEHAYYVDHQNNRGEYIKRFISAINWTFVEKNYKAAISKKMEKTTIKRSATEEIECEKSKKQKYERWDGMKIILGTMEFGRKANQKQSEEMVSSFLSHGHEELDTALMYAGGQTEQILGKMSGTLQEQMVISTKANPWKEGGLQPRAVLKQVGISLESLQTQQVDILYLHAPDHNTEIKETLKAVQDLYDEKKFKRFGLSNYAAWQVVEIYNICERNNWILPTVYQGMFNVITRDVYRELFPALRRLKISFYAYNPLAGGILTGKYDFSDQDEKKPSGRFFGNDWAKNYRKRYWNTTNFEAVKLIQNALKTAYPDNSVPIAQAVIRWMIHHSYLDTKFGDGVIIGASNISHLTENLASCKGGPLEEQVVKAMEEAWDICRPVCPQYFR